MTDDTQHPSIPSPVLPPDIDDFTYEQVETKEQIGTGGDANVYRATVSQNDTEHTIAVKEPRFEGTIQQEVIERFEKEAETWSKLDDHPNVVTVYSWGAKSLPWLGLEYMDGGTLESHLGDLAIEEALWLAGRIAEGIQQGHRHGVAHLDLKPSNVLLRDTPDAKYPYPKVSDWGLAKLLLEHSKSVEGLSPTYAAPEQFDTEEYGKTDNITDIYQFGAVVYALCTGEPPFTGSATSVMQDVITKSPTPPSERNRKVSEELDDILLKALSKEKENRHESIVLLRKQLDKQFNEYTDIEEYDNRDGISVSPAPSTDTSPRTSEQNSSKGAEATATTEETSGSIISRRTAAGMLGTGVIGLGAVGVLQSGVLQQTTQTEANATENGNQSSQPENSQKGINSIVNTQWKLDEAMIKMHLNENYLYGASGDAITKIDVQSAEKQWENTPKSHIQSSTAVNDLAFGEYVYSLGGADLNENITTKLYALNPDDGSEEWAVDGDYTRWRFPGHLTASSDYVAFVETNSDLSESIIKCFNSSNKEIQWNEVYSEDKRSTNGSTIGARIGDIHIEDGKLFILGQGPVEIRDIKTGELLQSDYAFESEAVHSVVTDNAIYTANREKVQRRNKDLSKTWTYRAPTRVTATPKVGPESDGKLIVPSQSGLQCLDKNTGTLLWEHQISGSIKQNIGNISMTVGSVWASDDQGFLYVLESESGEVYFEEQVIDKRLVSAGLEASESLVYLSLVSSTDSYFMDNSSGDEEKHVTKQLSVEL